MNTAFSSEVRVLVCSRCGAPLDVPLGGGVVRCHFCGAELTIPSRAPPPSATAARAEGSHDDNARLQRLRLQEATAKESPYDLRRRPAGLEWLTETYKTPADLAGAVSALEGVLRQEMQRAAGFPSLESEGRVFYVANILESASSLAHGDPRRLRAHLESVRDSFTDPGFRQLATCRLAGAARHVGDLAAANGWLQQCDATSGELPLDTAYRIALAGIQLRQQTYQEALATLGERSGRVPLSLSWKPAAQIFRIEALEKAGRQADADAEYDEASGWKGSATWLPAMIEANRDLGDLCALTIARWRASHPEGAEAAERVGVARAERLSRRARIARWVFSIVVLAFVTWRVVACASGG